MSPRAMPGFSPTVSLICVSLRFHVFMGLLRVGTSASLSVPCTFSWALFLLSVLSYSDVFVFSSLIVLYFIILP